MADYSNYFPPTEEELALVKKINKPKKNGFKEGWFARTIRYATRDTSIPDYYVCDICGSMVTLETWQKHKDWHFPKSFQIYKEKIEDFQMYTGADAFGGRHKKRSD
jgi:hypothetical protein